MPPSLLLSEASTQHDLVRSLIRYIQSDRLAAGDRLPPIRALATRFGVTGSAVRDAQIQLQTMGMIKILPRSGRIAWKSRLRPCLAEPPAESPSTR